MWPSQLVRTTRAQALTLIALVENVPLKGKPSPLPLLIPPLLTKAYGFNGTVSATYLPVFFLFFQELTVFSPLLRRRE